MANDVDKMLASAKNALASAKNFSRSAGDDPSRFAPKAAPVAAAPVKKVDTGIKAEAASAGTGIKDRMANEATAKASLPSYKKGGPVKKTGPAMMHKGEDVVKSDKSNIQDVIDRATSSLAGTAQNVMAKHGMRSTTVDHHSDGSHTVRHMPHMNTHEPGQEKSYAVKNTKELVSKLKEHLMDDAPETDEKV